MSSLYANLSYYVLGLGAIVVLLPKSLRRLELSRAKHRSLAGHARMSRRLAAFVPFYEYPEDEIFRTDHAPDDIAARRNAAFMRLSALYRERFARSLEATRAVRDRISDLKFTARNRVPFQFSSHVRKHLPVGAFVASSSGVTVTDLD